MKTNDLKTACDLSPVKNKGSALSNSKKCLTGVNLKSEAIKLPK